MKVQTPCPWIAEDDNCKAIRALRHSVVLSQTICRPRGCRHHGITRSRPAVLNVDCDPHEWPRAGQHEVRRQNHGNEPQPQ